MNKFHQFSLSIPRSSLGLQFLRGFQNRIETDVECKDRLQSSFEITNMVNLDPGEMETRANQTRLQNKQSQSTLVNTGYKSLLNSEASAGLAKHQTRPQQQCRPSPRYAPLPPVNHHWKYKHRNRARHCAAPRSVKTSAVSSHYWAYRAFYS